MTPFEYIALLTSIVIAPGITRVLTGLGRILQLRHGIKVYWVHLLWIGNVFLWLLHNWWILYRWRAFDLWSFFLFLFVLISPVVAFLLSVLLVPDPLEAGEDLKRHYYRNSRWFFLLAALLPPVDAVDPLLKGQAALRRQGTDLRRHVVLDLRPVPHRRIHQERNLSRWVLGFLPDLPAAFISINLRLLV